VSSRNVQYCLTREISDFFPSKYGEFGLFFSLKILCILQTRLFFFLAMLGNFTTKEKLQRLEGAREGKLK